MRTSEIVNLDYRLEENRQTIQKALQKIVPLKGDTNADVQLQVIEKLITLLSKKYAMSIKHFMPDVHSNSKWTIWYATVINDTNFEILRNVHGLSLYEVFAKAAIYMYSQRKKVGERR